MRWFLHPHWLHPFLEAPEQCSWSLNNTELGASVHLSFQTPLEGQSCWEWGMASHWELQRCASFLLLQSLLGWMDRSHSLASLNQAFSCRSFRDHHGADVLHLSSLFPPLLCASQLKSFSGLQHTMKKKQDLKRHIPESFRKNISSKTPLEAGSCHFCSSSALLSQEAVQLQVHSNAVHLYCRLKCKAQHRLLRFWV